MDTSAIPKNLNESRPSASKGRGRLIFAFVLIGFGLCLLFFAVALWLNEQNSEGSAETLGRPRVGAVMADFSLNDLQGIEVRLSDYQGRPVLLNFWATWCPPCREELPLFSDFYWAHEDSGFVILAVDVGEDWNLVADFAREQSLPFPVLLDPDQAFADSLRINAYPTSVLIGRDGKIKSVHVGMYTERALENDVLPYLDSK